MSYYFSKPKSLATNVKVQLDSCNYVIKADWKNATGANTSDFGKKQQKQQKTYLVSEPNYHITKIFK